MSVDDVREFIRTHHRAVLATRRPDSGVSMVPVLAVTDDNGDVLISTWETSAKVTHLRRDPYAYVCVMQDGFFGPSVQAEGTVTIETLPDAMESLVRYYRLAAGEHPDWDEYRAAMEREQRVLLRLRIERARG
ncbi:MAG TPA: PPOX class F420-dependent oxidoreductase [Chloroflexota bacterium]